MGTHAVIDIGTNSIKMHVATACDGPTEVLGDFTEVTRLGEGLHETRELNAEAIARNVEAVASFRDPDTYEELKHYLEYGTNRVQTYRAIRDLPGIELSDAIADAWRHASHSKWEAASMAPVAMEYGHLDALAYAVRTLTDPSPSDQRRYDSWRLWGAVGRHTNAPQSAEGLKRWFEENEGNLVFDPETRMFRVKGDE